MAYIGNTPAEKFSAFSKQDFTTSATTSYTLDNPVSNANEIALFINHVRQEPTTAYTAAGTALTLTSATTSSDDMYCVYLGKAVQTVNPANGSVDTAQLADSAVETAKINDGAVTSAKIASGVVGNNTPAFKVYRSSNQTMGNGYQKIQHNAEEFDTDNAFDSTTNYRFTVPSGKAGKYFFNAQHKLNSMPNGGRIAAAIYVNGSIKAHNIIAVGIAEDNSSNVSAIFDLSVGDYVEMYGYHNHSASLTAPGVITSVYFEGFKLIG